MASGNPDSDSTINAREVLRDKFPEGYNDFLKQKAGQEGPDVEDYPKAPADQSSTNGGNEQHDPAYFDNLAKTDLDALKTMAAGEDTEAAAALVRHYDQQN